jgi:hypothetical protein
MISILYLVAAIISGFRNDLLDAMLCLGLALALLGVRLLISLNELNAMEQMDGGKGRFQHFFNEAI